MSASQTWFGAGAVNWRASRFGASGKAWLLSVVVRNRRLHRARRVRGAGIAVGVAAERVRDVGDRLLRLHAVAGVVERGRDDGDPELAR